MEEVDKDYQGGDFEDVICLQLWVIHLLMIPVDCLEVDWSYHMSIYQDSKMISLINC